MSPPRLMRSFRRVFIIHLKRSRFFPLFQCCCFLGLSPSDSFLFQRFGPLPPPPSRIELGLFLSCLSQRRLQVPQPLPVPFVKLFKCPGPSYIRRRNRDRSSPRRKNRYIISLLLLLVHKANQRHVPG